MKELTAERLREVLHYDPETGVFTRLESGSRKDVLGRSAGTLTQQGYLKTMVDSRTYYLHRLAWLHERGTWPKDQMDHINGVKSDNRLANLRECSCGENQQNRARSTRALSPLPGVCWHKRDRVWVASVTLSGRRRNLGSFRTAEEASAAYLAEKARLHTFQPTPRVHACATSS